MPAHYKASRKLADEAGRQFFHQNSLTHRVDLYNTSKGEAYQRHIYPLLPMDQQYCREIWTFSCRQHPINARDK